MEIGILYGDQASSLVATNQTAGQLMGVRLGSRQNRTQS